MTSFELFKLLNSNKLIKFSNCNDGATTEDNRFTLKNYEKVESKIKAASFMLPLV